MGECALLICAFVCVGRDPLLGQRVRDRFSSEKRELGTMTEEFLKDDGGQMIDVLAETHKSFLYFKQSRQY